MQRFNESAEAFLEGMKRDPHNAQLKKGFEDAMTGLKTARFSNIVDGPGTFEILPP